MERRRFGRTGHESTVAIFGAAALWDVTQDRADQVMQRIMSAGVNHIDVAPSYGTSEERLGPWLARERKRFFLGCKTMERSKEGAAAELRRSLERLQVDQFDLYQIHAVTSFEELDEATRSGGALEALVEAQEEGLTRYIGITGHGAESPAVFYEALRRFDFDSVLFPVSFIQYADPTYRRSAERLVRTCLERDVGMMAIKYVSKRPWGDRAPTHTTWYEPFTGRQHIQQAIDFALSQGVTGICTAGDTTILPLVLEACGKYKPMPAEEQEALIASASEYEPLFV